MQGNCVYVFRVKQRPEDLEIISVDSCVRKKCLAKTIKMDGARTGIPSNMLLSFAIQLF